MDKAPISPDPQSQDASATPPETPKPPKRKPNYKVPRYLFLSLVLLLFFGIIGFVVYVGQTLPSFQEIENPQSDLSTQLLASDGSVLQTFFSRENRTNVRLDEISHYVIDALISTEDARFYQHSGVDPKSFLAIMADLVKGREIRGGSTITMQLARNLYRNQVGKEQTYIRKIKEYLVSTFLERQFTKEEIITAYLNTVNIYGNSYGIETTSRRLFNKAAKDLNIEEAAVIVAMLKGQGVYNPYRYPERVTGRRNLVISQMVKYGVVDSQRINIDSLHALPLKLAGRTQDHIKGLAPYFREYVRNHLRTWCEERGYNLYTDGLQVYTTLDPRMQFHAEEAVKEHLSDLQKTFNKQIKGYEPYKRDPSFLVDLMKQTERYRLAKKAGKPMGEIEKEFNTPTPMTIFSWNGYLDTTMTPMDSIRYSSRFLETGMVSIDPTNGHVKAWIGGIDYKFFKYDHVNKGKRQVGSTFKPFVYAAAIDNGKSPCDKILNQPVVFKNPGGKPWSPKNSDGSYGGLMTLRHGLATSTNLITAQLMNKVVNPSVVASYAYKLGIKSTLDEVPALCLGTTDLSVMELTNAYGTFANQGTWIEPVVITRIEDRHGNVLEEFIPETHVALSEEKAYLMVDLLKGVVDQPGGTGQRLRWKYGFTNEIGGKTGTTQNHSDGWFIGIRPNLATGVWVGCSDRRMRFRSIRYGQGANMALPIWALYMKRISEDPDIGIPTEDVFEKPAGIDHLLRCESNTDETDNKGKSSDELEELEGF